jgi:import inner membrane translocase subunit TIM23
MASPFKTFVLRYPCQAAAVATGRTAGLVNCVPKASSFSTAARPVTCLSTRVPARPQCLAGLPKSFTRANSDQASPSSRDVSAAAAPLDWNTFFDLRLKRRRVQLVFSVASSFVGGFTGAVALMAGAGELITEKIALDPVITLGLATLSFSALGWLAGPSIGSQVFWLRYRKWKKQMTQKEAEFFARIKKHRVDPSNSSASNPGS